MQYIVVKRNHVITLESNNTAMKIKLYEIVFMISLDTENPYPTIIFQ